MIGDMNIYHLPKYQELSVKLIWEYIKSNEELCTYFPYYSSETLPNKEFLMGIISTIRPQEIYELIKSARDKRSISGDTDVGQLVKIEKSIKEDIFRVLAHKSKYQK